MNEIGAIKYRLEQGYTMTRYGSKDDMIEQLIADTEYLLNKVENNDVLDLVSEELPQCNKSKWGDCECENECRRGLKK